MYDLSLCHPLPSLSTIHNEIKIISTLKLEVAMHDASMSQSKD